MLTILTPTYNRCEELKRLYASLCNQSCKNFDWLIVDDGSKDETEQQVEKWINEQRFKITYVKKENGGKHTALNTGIERITSAWTFIVDSDDYLTDDAVEVFYDKVVDVENRLNICGLAFLRQSEQGHNLSSSTVPNDGLVEDFCTCRYRRGIKGDMAEIWRTKYLKEFPFPVFEGERFLSEDVVWVQLAQKYKMVFYNRTIYIADYLDGGLTKTRRKSNMKSPKGCMYRGELHLSISMPPKYHIRAMLYYLVYGKVAGYTYSQLWKRCKKKLLYIMSFPVAVYLTAKWKKEYQ